MERWSLELIKKALNQYQNVNDKENTWLDNQHSKVNSAAVLLLLVKVQDKLSLVFIERAKNANDIHSGQVAFPGGKTEEKDHSFITTAIRETREEIGIFVDQEQVIGLLPFRTSRKQYQVRPVIACINWPQDLVLQAEEVATVFTLPLEWLADQNNLESATVLGLPEGATIVYKEYNNHRLWGLTAKIVDDFLQIISSQ